jgi:hypothetical protein
LRNSIFFSGIFIMGGSWTRSYSVGAASHRDSSDVVVVLCALGFVGALLSIATAKKVEWVRFSTDAGIVVLDVARAGKNRDKFDTFVEALTNRIRATRSEV